MSSACANLPGPGAKPMDVLDPAARSHEAEAPPRLERANQDQPAPGPAFHEHIEHPVHAVIHVNVDRARPRFARRTRECSAG